MNFDLSSFQIFHFQLFQETISLAEERFADNSGEWKFDNAWQEMLNHATIKVDPANILEYITISNFKGDGCREKEDCE